jgi:hypothetical protein
MFLQNQRFNQDLSDWDVSKGTSFVSDDQALQLFKFNILSLSCDSKLDAESLHHCCVAVRNKQSQPTSYFLFSLLVRHLCLIPHLPLIKTSVTGMSPRGQAS